MRVFLRSVTELYLRNPLQAFLLIPVLAGVLAIATPSATAQNESGGSDAGTCTLKDHIYTCNGAAFQAALLSSTTVGINVHNADGVARTQLTDMLTKKLGKSIANGTSADLIFLMMPIDPSGVMEGSGDSPLGTLRVYTVTPDGSRGHLLWAETFNGRLDMPWPAVVRGLILQFQSRFHIK